MKQFTLLFGESCGYCKKAKMLLKRALDTHPEFLSLDIRCISEQSGEAAALDHRVVPAFFCGGALFFEGNPDMDAVMAALECCMRDGGGR